MLPPQRTEYQLSDVFFRQLTGNLLKRIVPLMIVAALAGIYIGGIRFDAVGSIALVLVLTVLALSLWFNVGRQQRSFRSFRVSIDGESLERTQDGYATVALRREDIGAVIENQHGLVVTSSDGDVRLWIPHTLENYEAFKAQLASFHPITPRTSSRSAGLLTLLASLAVIADMVVVYRSRNSVIVLAAGLALTAFLVWFFVAIQRSSLIERRVKRWAWMMLFVLFSIAGPIFSAVQQLVAAR